MQLPKTVSELMLVVSKDNLINSIIQQLNKDFHLCNLNINYELDLTASLLFEKLVIDVHELFTDQYDDYLNLMYRMDISEQALLQIIDGNSTYVSEQISFLILKRAYQKVWLKSNFRKL